MPGKITRVAVTYTVDTPAGHDAPAAILTADSAQELRGLMRDDHARGSRLSDLQASPCTAGHAS